MSFDEPDAGTDQPHQPSGFGDRPPVGAQPPSSPDVPGASSEARPEPEPKVEAEEAAAPAEDPTDPAKDAKDPDKKAKKKKKKKKKQKAAMAAREAEATEGRSGEVGAGSEGAEGRESEAVLAARQARLEREAELRRRLDVEDDDAPTAGKPRKATKAPRPRAAATATALGGSLAAEGSGEATEVEGAGTGNRAAAGGRRTPVAAIAAVAVGIVLILVAMTWGVPFGLWGVRHDRNHLSTKQHDRSAATKVANTYVQTLLTQDTADPASKALALAKLKTMSTSAFAAKLHPADTSTLPSGAASNLQSQGTVRLASVTHQSSGSVQVLVVALAKITGASQTPGGDFGQLIVTLDLRHEHGQWKVNNVQTIDFMAPVDANGNPLQTSTAPSGTSGAPATGSSVPAGTTGP